MGMVEERKTWAVNTVSHSERMYKETSNPYYVITALAATSIGDFLPPEWALEILLEGVRRAWSQANEDGKEISLDKALGLRAKRGGSPTRRGARRASVEDAVFQLVKIIHACFDLSIPSVCEVVYYSIDKVFADDMEECLWQPRNRVIFSDESLKKIGITREHYDEIERKERNRSECTVENGGHPKPVLEKLRAYKWWDITRGERLGYSLDQFIDRYYRIGSKRTVPHGHASEQLMLFFEGHRLLMSPEYCAYKITIVERKGDHYDSTSALIEAPQRSDFQRFHEGIIAHFEAADRK